MTGSKPTFPGIELRAGGEWYVTLTCCSPPTGAEHEAAGPFKHRGPAAAWRTDHMQQVHGVAPAHGLHTSYFQARRP